MYVNERLQVVFTFLSNKPCRAINVQQRQAFTDNLPNMSGCMSYSTPDWTRHCRLQPKHTRSEESLFFFVATGGCCQTPRAPCNYSKLGLVWASSHKNPKKEPASAVMWRGRRLGGLTAEIITASCTENSLPHPVIYGVWLWVNTHAS